MNIGAAFDVLARRRDRQVVIPTMSAIDLWRSRSPSPRNLPAQGFMGGGSALGLGIQLARPDVPVWILDGDASLAMQLGSLLTIAEARPRRFLHVVVHNGINESSGGQPLVAEGSVSFAGLARAAGYPHAEAYRSLEDFERDADRLIAADGPVLAELYTHPRGAAPPRQPGVRRSATARLRGVARRVRARLAQRRRRAGPGRAALELAANWPRVRDALAEDH